jgi:hypothetical protein
MRVIGSWWSGESVLGLGAVLEQIWAAHRPPMEQRQRRVSVSWLRCAHRTRPPYRKSGQHRFLQLNRDPGARPLRRIGETLHDLGRQDTPGYNPPVTRRGSAR